MVDKLIREGDKNIKMSMEGLLSGETLRTQIDEQIIFEQLGQKNSAIWSLLLAAGYLRVEEYIFDDSDGKERYSLALTNREVRLMFGRMIEGWFSESSAAYNDFIRALLCGDTDAMNTYMNDVVFEMFSYFDTGKNPARPDPERFYHGLVLGLMVDLADRYIITSNRESGFGRYDILLEPRREGDMAFIMEFKVYNPKREKGLEETVRAALEQIEAKGYVSALKARGILPGRIRKYGFAFAGKQVLIGRAPVKSERAISPGKEDGMAKKVTLADIAARAGVSSVAVYKALADKPGVSDALRGQIRELAAQMGYVSAAARKAEAAARTGNIGIVVPEQYYGYSLSFYGQLHEKVVKALYRNDYFGMLEVLTPEGEKNLSLPRLMQDGKVDGMIFLGQMGEEYIGFLASQEQLPIFFLDTCVPLASLDTVISDGYYGTYLLTDYLIRQGHRRIGFVGRVDATSSIADRYWGYRRALRENRIAFEPSWEIPDRDEKGNLFQDISGQGEEMEAFVCNCDFTADILIRSLEAKGLRVPEDISVVGVDDFLPQGMDNDRITTYRVDMERMAELCVRSLIRKINGKKYSDGIQIVSGEIVYIKSVAKRN